MALTKEIFSFEFSWFDASRAKRHGASLPEIHSKVDPCESFITRKQYRMFFLKGMAWREVYFWN